MPSTSDLSSSLVMTVSSTDPLHGVIFTELTEKGNSGVFCSFILDLASAAIDQWLILSYLRYITQLLFGPKRYLQVFSNAKNNSTSY